MKPQEQIKCHGNLNRGCLSVVPRSKGAKTSHHHNGFVTLSDAIFKVSQSGHARIVEQQRRKVCAQVHGTVESWTPCDFDLFEFDPNYQAVSYNPKTRADKPFFHTLDGTQITTVKTAVVITDETIDTKAKTRAYIPK